MVSSKLSLFASVVCTGLLLVSGRPFQGELKSVQCVGDCKMIFRDCFFGCDQTASGDIGHRTEVCNAMCEKVQTKCLADCARLDPGVSQEAPQVGAIPFTCDWDYEACMSTYQQTRSEFTKKYCMDKYQSCKDSVSTKTAVAAAAAPSAATELTGACNSGCESIYHSGVAKCRSSCASNADAQGCTTGCIQRRYNEMADCKRGCKASAAAVESVLPSSPRLGELYPCRNACADTTPRCRRECKIIERTPAGVKVCEGECEAAEYKCFVACHDTLALESPEKPQQVAGPACVAGCKLTADTAKVACKLQRRQHRQRCEENVAKVEKDCELACLVIPTAEVTLASSPMLGSCKDDCQYDYDVCLRGCALKYNPQERRDCKVDCMQTMDVDACVSYKCRK